MTSKRTVRLADFGNEWYEPGRSRPIRALWLVLGRVFLESSLPWPYRFKAALLRLFGAKIGVGVVIKNRVVVKYPWNLEVGDHTWIGEAVSDRQPCPGDDRLQLLPVPGSDDRDRES